MGGLVILTALLAWIHSNYWLIGALIVGVSLFIYGVTDFCLLKLILKKLDIGE